jgi:hypothetical protein
MQSPLRDWKLDSETRAVLRLLARGMHVSDIAAQMDVPLRHKRLGAETNEHLISHAVSEGFTYLED